MKYIPLTQGKYTVVDDKDYEYLNQWKWCLRGRPGHYYAGRVVQKNNVVTTIWMHRLINNTPDGYETDHRNRNKLDNQRRNLRTFTHAQNVLNAGPQRNNKSGYRGVSWHKQRKKWTARAKIDGKYKSLGLFTSPKEASKVYQEAVKHRFEEEI